MTEGPAPTLTVLVTARDAAADPVATTAASLLGQTDAAWELVVAVDGDDGERVRAAVADPRLRIVAGPARPGEHARGAWVLVLEAGDTLAPTAVARLRAAAATTPTPELIYADEDEPADGPDDRRVVRKPVWSPERVRHGNYLGRMVAVRASALSDVDGLAPDAGPAADYDLVLRVSERGAPVVHLATVLLHRATPDVATDERDAAARTVAEAHLRRIGVAADVVPGPVPGSHRLRRAPLPRTTGISLIMPTGWTRATVRGQERCLVLDAARTLLAGAAGTDVELVVVYDEPVPPGLLDELRAVGGDRLVLVPFDAPFNFSEKCNVGFLHARGEVVVLVNDDIEPITPDWLATLVAPLAEPDVGMTGAKLLYEDGSIQHGGHVHARRGAYPRPALAWRHAPGDTVGGLNSLHVDRETSGVTAACAALRREVFEQVGGLTEDLPFNYNDVDLAMKIQRCGYRVLWLAEPVLFHFESKSRPVEAPAVFEREFVRRRWGTFPTEPFLPWRPV